MSTLVEITSFVPATITLDEAKEYARVDTTTDDNIITTLLASAQQEALGYTHVIFGSGVISVLVQGYQEVIPLPYLPLISVTSFKLDGVESTEYSVVGTCIVVTATYEECEILYDAGRDQPDDVKLALLQRVKFTYDYPDDMVYEKTRFFERIMFRYREPSTFN